MIRWRQLCGTSLALLGAGQALAHPHIWIDSFYQVNLSSPQVEALEAYWTFDVLSSVDMLMEFDKNADGRLEGIEKVEAAKAMTNLAQYNYFLHLQVEGNELTPKQVDVVDVDVNDQALTVRLGITLAEPVDLRQHTLRLGFGDPENYFALVVPEAGPIKLTGMLAETCTPVEAEAEEFYMEGWVDLQCDS